MTARTGRAPTLIAALLALVVVLAGCSGSKQHAATPQAGQPATVRTATCTTWQAAPTAEKWRLVHGMRAFFGAQVDSPGVRGHALPDARAMSLFNSYCNQLFAGAFALYRIYGNAAAFTVSQK